MPFNGAGSFSPPGANYPAVANTLITAANRNAVDADIATGLSTAICKDGQTTVTANIPLAGFKLTGVGTGTALTDAATLTNIVNGTGVYVATVGGTANAIILTPSPAIAAYAAGQTFRFIVGSANTSTVTVAVSGLTAKAITKNGATALRSGDLPAGFMAQITYDGTQFVLSAFRIPEVGTDSNSNTWLGATGLDSLSSGTHNTALGTNALTAVSSGGGNVALGSGAGDAITTAGSNVAIGKNALGAYTISGDCIAIGEDALLAFNPTAQTTPNLAIGTQALKTVTGTGAADGEGNTAVGFLCMRDMTTGFSNVGLGNDVMQLATTAAYNTALGSRAMVNGIITGQRNTAVGRTAMHNLTGGDHNTGVGGDALYYVTTGTGNVGVGRNAGVTNTAANALTTGSNNTYVGHEAGPDTTAQLSNAHAFGYRAKCTASNQLVLGGTGTEAVNVGIGTFNPSSAKLQVEFDTANGIMSRNTAASGVAQFILKNPSRQWEVTLRGDGAGAFDDEFRIDDGTAATIPFRIQATCPTNTAVLTAGGNVKIAGTASRATTEGTNHLDIFDGTAPVGTLANGCSLYSTAGELRVMDAAGNATLLSPHDREGFWIYHSKDTVTGKVLRIDMEKMLKKLNAERGWDFVHECIEA